MNASFLSENGFLLRPPDVTASPTATAVSGYRSIFIFPRPNLWPKPFTAQRGVLNLR
jgi:hypothetical protein